MTNSTAWIILIIVSTVLLFLLIILLFIKLGILGQQKIKADIKIYVNDGMNIDGSESLSRDKGLNGFCEDHSGTLIVESGERKSGIQVCLTDTQNGKKYSIMVSNVVIVGRKNIYMIPDFLEIPEEISISKKHISISRYGNKLYIEDLGSTYHTWLNGQYVSSNCELHNGDVIRMGNSEFRLNISW